MGELSIKVPGQEASVRHPKHNVMYSSTGPGGLELVGNISMPGSPRGTLLLSQEVGIICLEPFYNSKGDLTCGFVSSGKGLRGEICEDEHVRFRGGGGSSGEVTGENNRWKCGCALMAFSVFIGKAVKRAVNTGRKSMGTISMAEANHRMGYGVLAAAQSMHSTV